MFCSLASARSALMTSKFGLAYANSMVHAATSKHCSTNTIKSMRYSPLVLGQRVSRALLHLTCSGSSCMAAQPASQRCRRCCLFACWLSGPHYPLHTEACVMLLGCASFPGSLSLRNETEWWRDSMSNNLTLPHPSPPFPALRTLTPNTSTLSTPEIWAC